MLTDLLSIAPPIGRVRPRVLDFGVVSGSAPRRAELQCFNVGGGTLEGDVATGCPWLEVNASGMATVQASRFRRNRQSVLVTAYPDRIRSRGLPVEGTIHVRFPGLFNEAWLYVNGHLVAHREYKEPWWLSDYKFEWDVDLTGHLRAGANTVAVRVYNPHHFGGMFRRPFLYRPVAGK